MKKTRTIWMICLSSMLATATTIPCEQSAMAIDLATNFLARVEGAKPFTYQDECHFLGEMSLLSAFLFRQYGYIHENGHWRRPVKPRKSLLGNVIQAHREVFSTKGFGEITTFYDRCGNGFGNVTIIVSRDFNHGWLPAKADRVSRVFRFLISWYHGKPRLELSDSSVDCMSVPYLLGFRERIELYGMKKDEVNSLYYAEKSPDT